MILNKFGTFIHVKREGIHMLQKELSEGICTRSMISRIENEDYFPHVTIVEKLLDRLGVPVSELLDELCKDNDQRVLEIIIQFLNDRYDSERDVRTIQRWIQKIQGTSLLINHIHQAHLYSLQAFIEDIAQNFKEAERNYNKLIDLARKLNEVPLLASGLARLTFMNVNIDPHKASDFIEEAHSLITRYSVPQEVNINVNLVMGAHKYAIGEYYAAIQIFEAVKRRKKLTPIFKFRSHNLLGKCFHAIGEYTKAETEFKQTRSYFKYHLSHEMIYYVNIGDLYADMGEYDLAFQHQNRSLQLAIDSKQPYFAEIARLRLAKLNNLIGKYDRAELICKEVIEESWNQRNIYIAKLIISESQHELYHIDCTQTICEVVNFFNGQEGRDAVHYQKEAYKLLARVNMPKQQQNLFPTQLLIY
jgi:tetratricopeptide (TPR) repeat protein